MYFAMIGKIRWDGPSQCQARYMEAPQTVSLLTSRHSEAFDLK